MLYDFATIDYGFPLRAGTFCITANEVDLIDGFSRGDAVAPSDVATIELDERSREFLAENWEYLNPSIDFADLSKKSGMRILETIPLFAKKYAKVERRHLEKWTVEEMSDIKEHLAEIFYGGSHYRLIAISVGGFDPVRLIYCKKNNPCLQFSVSFDVGYAKGEVFELGFLAPVDSNGYRIHYRATIYGYGDEEFGGHASICPVDILVA